ncbi:MAG: sigma-70 family RNA polymerase sigma factor [Planctomycetes bacterium]|nr:sigma-70 family RNA polymerase sigma factor [Planctomycetota bacterium]
MIEPQTADWAAQRLERWRSARDGEALGELLKWQRVRAYATAQRILRQDSDAEDAVQQAFLKLLSRSEGFENERAFKAAVYRAVVQCALDLARARQARNGRERSMENVHAAAATPAQRSAEQAEALRWLHEELGSLSAEDRAVVTLCCQEGLNLAEAADVLGAPRETLRDRLARTLHGLRARLKKRGASLSLLLLVGLLHQGQAHAAPAGLAAALDAALPGAGCAKIAAAGAAPLQASAVLAQAGIFASAGALALKVGFAAAVLVLALGGYAALHGGADGPASATGGTNTTQQAGASPVGPMVAAKPLAVKAPAAETKSSDAPPKTVAVDAKPAPDAALPPEIKAAAEAALKGFKIAKVEKETKGGKTIYDIEGTADGKRYELEVSAEGKVLEVKEADEDEDKEDAGAKKARKPDPPPPDAF